MMPFKLPTLVAGVILTVAQAALAIDDYKLGPDSQPQEGVPKGQIVTGKWIGEKIYAGTERDYWISIPAQYDGSKPACLMVFQDGGGYAKPDGQFRIPVVFDNLIHRKEMPVTIGVFLNPGNIPASQPGQKARSNRSFEYDSLGDLYVRFVLEEILPGLVEKHKLKLTDDPEGRGTCGISSGGICAFTMAWERPDQFRKVISHIGSFTNIRGGHVYPALIRKTEKKPLRIFLQDGSNDLDNLHGHWPLANQQMASSLQFKKYDYQFEFGDGGHSGKHGGMLLPDTLRWLWRDYPK